MPTYAYACTVCGHRFDEQQSFTDAALSTCPVCTGRLRKLYPSVGVVFKGSGFYRTDSRSGSTARSALLASTAGGAGGSSSGGGDSGGAGAGGSAGGSSSTSGGGDTGGSVSAPSRRDSGSSRRDSGSSGATTGSAAKR